MARYDAWPNPEGPGWLLEVQADLLRDLNTRVVVPLMPPADAPQPAARLNPVLTGAGVPTVTVTQFLSAVPASLLRGPPVSLAKAGPDISYPLDLLLTGV